MDDLISRQAAIEAMENMYKAAEKWMQEAKDDITGARAESCMASLVEMKLRIEKLPSAQPETMFYPQVDGVTPSVIAQPEQKKGEWLEHYAHEDGERDGVWCSECREHYYFGGQLMNFCPNCGADMRGESNE